MTHEELIDLAHKEAAAIMSALGPKSRPAPEVANALFAKLCDVIRDTVLDHVTMEDDGDEADIAPEYGTGG